MPSGVGVTQASTKHVDIRKGGECQRGRGIFAGAHTLCSLTSGTPLGLLRNNCPCFAADKSVRRLRKCTFLANLHYAPTVIACIMCAPLRGKAVHRFTKRGSLLIAQTVRSDVKQQNVKRAGYGKYIQGDTYKTRQK